MEIQGTEQTNHGARRASEAHGERTDWRAIMLAVGAGIISAMQIGKAPSALPIIAADLELSRVMAGLVASLFFAFGAVFSVAIGGVVDRFSARSLLLVGLALLTLGSLIGGLVADSATLLATRVIEGVGYVAVIVSAPKIVFGAARPADLPLAMGVLSTFIPIGIAIILVVSPFVLGAIGWQGVWLVNAALLAAFSAMLALVWRSGRSGGRGQAGAGADAPAAEPAPAPVFDWSGVRILLARPGPWLLGLIFMLYTIQWFAVMAWLPTFLIENQGRSLTNASLFAALVVIVNVTGNVAGGWMMTRRGAPPSLLIGISLAVAAATLPLVYSGAVGGDAKILLAIAFSALTGVLVTACLAGAAAHSPSPAQIGMSNGIIMQGATIGNLLGPPLLGALTASFGSWENFWWAMLVCPAIGFALVVLLRGAERRLAPERP